MANNDWLDFPEFDVDRWRSETSGIRAKEVKLWEKPIWKQHVHAQDLPRRAIAPPEAGNPWSLTQSMAAKTEVLPALMGGAEGIRLAHSTCDPSWLEGVHLNMVHVYLDADATALHGFDLPALVAAGWKGNCTVRVAGTSDAVIRKHASACGNQGLRTWMVDTSNQADVMEALVNALHQCEAAIAQFEAAGLDAGQQFSAFVWKVLIGVHVLEGVAFLRAARRLWQRWLQARGLPDVPIWLDAQTVQPAIDGELKTDRLIGMTTAAYAAVVGGADSIEVIAHDHNGERASAEGNRWARNVQHLLREESGLHRVFDPMGGSNTLEAWTDSLTEGAWDQFEQRATPTS